MKQDTRSPAEALQSLADWCAEKQITRDDFHSVGIRWLCSEAHLTPQAAIRIYGDCTNWTHQGFSSEGQQHFGHEDGDVEVSCMLSVEEARQFGKLFPVKDQ